MNTVIPAVTPTDLARELLSPDRPFLLDVREDFERGIACLDDDAHIPLGELEARLNELDANRRIVVYCRSGARSGRATGYLLSQGFKDVRNLDGGILGWAAEVDPTTQTY